MSNNASSQKFIERNRPPRVQINCDIETYGARIKVDLPFIAGVMADLSGAWEEDLEKVDAEEQEHRGELIKRQFQDFTSKNFDPQLKAMRPKVVCRVADTLSGKKGAKRDIELVFESMEDFSPDQVARQVEPLRKLLDTRSKLKNLLTYMGTKKKAQQVLMALFENRDVLKALMAAPSADERAKS